MSRRDDREFEAEVAEHLRLLADHYLRQGMSSADAQAAARRQFGNTTRLREERRALQTIPSLESMWIDLRHAARRIREREPALRRAQESHRPSILAHFHASNVGAASWRITTTASK